jgi:hypothetical protein
MNNGTILETDPQFPDPIPFTTKGLASLPHLRPHKHGLWHKVFKIETSPLSTKTQKRRKRKPEAFVQQQKQNKDKKQKL